MRGNFSILEIHCWILLLSKDISGGWLLKWVGWTMNWGMKQWRLLALIHFRKRRRASALWVDNLKARECFQQEERKKRKKITAIANEIDTYAGWWQQLGCQKVGNRCIEFHPKTGVSRDRAVSCFLGFISSSRDLILVVVFRSKVFFFGHYFVFFYSCTSHTYIDVLKSSDMADDLQPVVDMENFTMDTLLHWSHQSLDYFFVECEWFPIFSVDESISWPPIEGSDFSLKTTDLDEESWCN